MAAPLYLRSKIYIRTWKAGNSAIDNTKAGLCGLLEHSRQSMASRNQVDSTRPLDGKALRSRKLVPRGDCSRGYIPRCTDTTSHVWIQQLEHLIPPLVGHAGRYTHLVFEQQTSRKGKIGGELVAFEAGLA